MVTLETTSENKINERQQLMEMIDCVNVSLQSNCVISMNEVEPIVYDPITRKQIQVRLAKMVLKLTEDYI